jgi:formamidopyrimidine-DNA glycosylase
MPELPEVETMRRGVLPVVGQRVADVARAACPRKPIEVSPRIDHFQRRAVGRLIVDVRRAGKRVLVMLDTGDAIVFEPRMTGLVLIADPPDELYLRVRIQLESPSPSPSAKRTRGSKQRTPGSCLLAPASTSSNGHNTAAPQELLYWDRRGLGNVRLLTPAEQAAAFGPPKLGPDALAITLDELRANLARSRRAIKVALLDQTAVAGIGNLYASEMLHVAAIHPATPCHRLRPSQWSALHAAVGEILNAAIKYEGSTLGDGTYRNALNQQGGYQNHHRVYDREAQACPTCAAGKIERITQAQRSTFFCPKCQSRRVTLAAVKSKRG